MNETMTSRKPCVKHAKTEHQEEGIQCYKVVILGATGVGKTCLAARLTCREAPYHHAPTVGLDFTDCTLIVDGQKVRANIWDTAGQERFHSLVPAYCRSAQGAIFVFDLTDLRTFLSLDSCLLNASSTLPDKVCKLVVGNKKDLADKGMRAVTINMAEDFAHRIGASYVELSVLEDDDVADILQGLILEIIHTYPQPDQYSLVDLKPRRRDKQNSGKMFSCC